MSDIDNNSLNNTNLSLELDKSPSKVLNSANYINNVNTNKTDKVECITHESYKNKSIADYLIIDEVEINTKEEIIEENALDNNYNTYYIEEDLDLSIEKESSFNLNKKSNEMNTKDISKKNSNKYNNINNSDDIKITKINYNYNLDKINKKSIKEYTNEDKVEYKEDNDSSNTYESYNNESLLLSISSNHSDKVVINNNLNSKDNNNNDNIINKSINSKEVSNSTIIENNSSLNYIENKLNSNSYILLKSNNNIIKKAKLQLINLIVHNVRFFIYLIYNLYE